MFLYLMKSCSKVENFFLVLMEVVVIDDAAGDKDGVQVVSEGIK